MAAYQSLKRELQRVSRWHPRQVACVRIAVGIWLLALTAILYSSGHGGQWAWLLIPTAAIHFFIAYHLFRAAKRDSVPSLPSRYTIR